MTNRAEPQPRRLKSTRTSALSNPTKAPQLNLCGRKELRDCSVRGIRQARRVMGAPQPESMLASLSVKVVLIAPSVNLATFPSRPQCSGCFHVCLQLWRASLPGTHSEHIHVFTLCTLLSLLSSAALSVDGLHSVRTCHSSPL